MTHPQRHHILWFISSFLLLLALVFIWLPATAVYNTKATALTAVPQTEQKQTKAPLMATLSPVPGRAQWGATSPIFYPAFTTNNTDNLELVGDAQLEPNALALRLTDTAPCCQSGAAWYGVQQRVGDGFLTVFDFRITDTGGGGGADGLAFVIQDAAAGVGAQGGGGCAIGYGGIERSLAIEIDTYANPPNCETNQDPNGNHISIQTRGTLPNSPEQQYSRGVYTPATNLSDGQVHTLLINYEAGILSVYLDIDEITPQAIPIITTTIDLSTELELTDDMAWVGLVAGTGTVAETHDILNWYFLDDYDLTCVTYHFDREPNGSYNFNPVLPQGGIWPTEGKGWQTITGSLMIDRGINYYVSERVPNINDGFDPRILNLINPPVGSSEAPYPIEQIRLYYEWLNHPAGVTLQGSYQLLVEGNSTPLSGSWSIVDGAPGENGWLATAVNLDTAQSLRPKGLRLGLQASDSTAVIRLKRASLCIETGPPARPPVVPPGAPQACADLLQNISTRQQPFGQSNNILIPSQPEFQFPANVTLEPYPEFYLGAAGYPDSLTFHTLLNNDLLVPCVFKQNGAYYDPDPGAPIPFQPIVRFTTVSNNAFLHESLSLLNYSGYFSVGSRDDWCYARDNVFGTIFDRGTLTSYLPGYNVPPPRNHCLDPSRGGIAAGPCGSFMGSLFRAMGYFNVPAFAAVYNTEAVKYAIGNLYYGVDAYVDALPDQQIQNVSQPFVDVDYSNRTTYITNSVTYSGIRVFALKGDGSKIYGLQRNGRAVDPIRCESSLLGVSAEDCALARELVSGHWDNEISIELRHSNTITDPQLIWQNIKPGDIAITIIETADPPNPQGVRGPDVNTHVQVVVGWGPKTYNQSVRYGYSLFPTLNQITPTLQSQYVPYVIDRGDLPGTGHTTGPRPFSYEQWHTATDFWVADVPIPLLPIAEQTAVPDPLTTPSFVESSTNQMSPENAAIYMTHIITGPVPASGASAVAWQPTGNQIALGNRDGLYLYTADLASFTAVDTNAVIDVAWSPDGQYLLAGYSAQQAKVWDIANNRQLIATLTGHTAELTSISWSPNGHLIGATAKDGRFYLWDATTFALAQTIPYTGSSYLIGHAWSPDGTQLAGLDTQNLYIWDAITGNLLHTISDVGMTGNSLAWFPDNQHIVIAGAHVWNINTGQEVGAAFNCSSGTDTLMALSPDGSQLARSGISADGAAICLDTLDNQFYQQEQVLLETHEHFAGAGAIDWHPTGTQLVVTSQSGWLTTWSVADGSLLAVGPRPGATIEEIEYWLRRCTTSGAEEYMLLNQFLAEEYAAFVASVQASNGLNAYCAPYLTAVATYYTENDPPGSPEPVTPLPLTAHSACPSETPDNYIWHIQNPNPYDVVVYWGWSEAFPELSPASVVIPANESWDLITPRQGDFQTIRLISGNFETTVTYSPMSCTAMLPIITK